MNNCDNWGGMSITHVNINAAEYFHYVKNILQ